MQNLSSNGFIGPFGYRKKIKIFLAGLEHCFNITPPKIVGKQLLWSRIDV